MDTSEINVKNIIIILSSSFQRIDKARMSIAIKLEHDGRGVIISVSKEADAGFKWDREVCAEHYQRDTGD